MSLDLPLIWAGIIALAVLMYVLLDGFDLGIGILFPFFPDQHDRDLMMHTVAPVWDGNETWLVLGGAGLFAAFPMLYSTVLSALYLPLVLMLVCLIFRGVSFEIRAKANRTKHLWDLAFIGGSTGAAFFQGIALGAFLQGIPVVDGSFAGDAFGWLTPFSLLTGLGLVVTYALLGCCWLVAKTEGDLQRRLHRVVWPLTIVLLGFIVVVSLWTPLLNDAFARRWFTWPGIVLTSPVPLLVALVGWLFRRSLSRPPDVVPLLCAQAWFALCYAGLGISLWPMIAPPDITVWNAAAPAASQGFLLVGAVVLIPVILACTGYAYWVFRGKVRPGMHYH